MDETDVQGMNIHPAEDFRNIRFRRSVQFQSSQCVLDRNFPDRGGGQEKLRGLGREQFFCTRVKFVFLGSAPKQDRRVEQKPHGFFRDRFSLPSNASRISSGRGASKSSGTTNFPRSIPSFRQAPLPARAGTRRATGTPRLAIVISSP